MNIDHMAMYVQDLEGCKLFFEKYFGAVANDLYHNPKTGLQTYFLKFSEDTRLEIINRPDMKPKTSSLLQTGYIHLAFSTGSKEAVDDLTQRIQTDGYEVISAPRTTGDGYYESCILGPENNQIEITV